jgi:hypothetical protein
MHRVFSVYGRKIVSVVILYNALVTITCAAGLLWGFYVENWKLYPPYLLNGNLFWLVIAAAIINIFPATYMGKVHTGRLWFHHYVYGFITMVASLIYIAFFTPVSLLTAFFVNTTNLSVNVGRFFFLGGLTLFLDDLPDVHRLAGHGLKWLKLKACQIRNVLHGVQLAMGFVAIAFFLIVSLSISAEPQWITPANFIQMGTLLATAFTSFGSVKMKIWCNLDNREEDSH